MSLGHRFVSFSLVSFGIMNRLLFIVFAISLWSCQTGSKGEMAPEIALKLEDGTPFKLSELRGNYVVLDFWASWCGPCIHDMPKLVALHRKYGDRVTFVSIAFEKNDKRWRAAAEKGGMDWKYQLLEETSLLLSSPIARDYRVASIPAKFIVTPEGKLISGMDFEQMDAYLEASLKE